MRKLLFTLILFSISTTGFSQNCPPSSDPGIHVVQKGQTYYRLSKIYGVTVDQILAWNGRTTGDVLSICEQIRVAPYNPTTTTTTTPTTGNTGTTTSGNTGTSGSTANTGTTTVTGVSGSDIPPGRYSKPFNQYQTQVKGVHYVREDENLVGIAALYGYTPDRFREFNGMNSGEEVITGQVLRTTDCACLDTITDSDEDRLSDGSGGFKDKILRRTGGSASSGNTSSDNSSSGNSSNTNTNTSGNRNSGNRGNVSTTPSGTGATASKATAKASYMRNEELLMVDEINLIRSNPQGYIPYVQEYISYLQKNGSFGNSIQTARELILELQKTPALSTLEPRECVFNAARKHGADEKRLGRNDHMGSDGSWPWDRILRECPSLQDGNENLVGGPSDIRRAVMLLLVDDGIPNRGHRKTLLNPSWRYVACYKVGMVGSMPNSWVQNFAY